MIFKTLRAACIVAPLALAPLSAFAAEFNDKQRDEIGTIIREYLLKNPEVLVEVGQELERRQKLAEADQRKSGLVESANEIFRSADDFVAGNPQGDVTIVEFFDYNCPWCKKSMPVLKKLLESDKKLKLVLKEFPILGESSEYAARAAIAAKAQGKYWEFHTALYEQTGRLSEAGMDGVAQSLGLDLTKLKADMQSPATTGIIQRNRELAQKLGINGTPGFVIDDEIIPGFVAEEGMLAAVKEVRDTGGCKIC